MDVVYLETVVFFYDFTVLVASVQPNLRIMQEFFLKLTPMVRLGNRTYQPRENEPTLFKHQQRGDDSQ